MLLKYLEVQGFKSFPEKVKIEFNKGITGIVGPNGSGKSNISDAIRWVMGEQSVKSLRGGKMEDVIFAGTQERQPVGFAEVSICFDNTDKMFNVEYNEVLITRRYFRSGESEYYINKNSCRLKDIHELFMDTGMGRDGYSVIGQGKIDELITAKPEERRVIFEEASGISKYRYKKIESERKIESTQENLIRLLDIISELEVRIDPLKRESEKAKEYINLKAELKNNEINLSVNLMEKIKETLDKLKEDNITINNDITDTQSKIEALDASFEELRKDSKDKEQKQEEYNQTVFDIKSAISGIENEINILINSLEFSSDNADRIRKEIIDLTEKTEEIKDNINSEFAEKEKAELLISELTEKLTELVEKYEKADNDAENSNSEIDEYNNKILEHYKLLAEKNAEIASARKEAESLKLRQNTINDDIEISLEDVNDAKMRLDDTKQKIESKQNDVNETDNNHSALVKEKEEITHKKEELYSKISAMKNDISSSQEKMKMLEDMENDMDGYNYSVKSVLNAKLPGVKIYGVVAKIIDVDTKYATAIDAVLGNVLQNIVTETEKDAKEAIEYLKKIRGGRATFLPVSEVLGRTLDETDFKNEKGYISLASEVVNCQDKFNSIVDEILGRTLLFDSLDNAIFFSRKFKYKYKIVTLDGDVINAGGAITGGNLSKGNSFLSRAAQIKELKLKIQRLEKELVNVQNDYDKTKAEEEKAFADVENINSLLQQHKNDLFKLEYNLEHYLTDFEEKNNELIELKAEKEELVNRITDLEKLEKEGVSIQSSLNKEISDMQAKIKVIQEENNLSLSRAKDINTQITGVKIELSEAESEKSFIQQKISQLEANLLELSEKIDQKNKEIGDGTNQQSDITVKIDAYKAEIAKKQLEIDKFLALVEEIKQQREENDKKLTLYNEQVREYNDKLILLAQDKTRIEEKTTRKEAEFGNINSRLWDEYELTYITALEYKKEVENLNELQKYVNTLKNKIRNLGDVNVNAIEEYAEVKERYEFLTKQRDDLEDAKKSLNNIIKDMEGLMIKQFTEQLKIINTTFTRVFKELFNGGSAELILTDEENILTSGVEIIAQPPGKKLQNMTLFSGGEKAIIAIALLFSLLEVRPSPLCVLDEIEAALDDVNVYRFASYLRKISKSSQIAIITHRRGTMEEADVLYGVTMPEKGVSKLIKLNINEVEDKILN